LSLSRIVARVAGFLAIALLIILYLSSVLCLFLFSGEYLQAVFVMAGFSPTGKSINNAVLYQYYHERYRMVCLTAWCTSN
jgi:hypothetical protein